MKFASGTASHRGVTLIEASIVLVVLSILVSLAAPGMQGMVDGRRLNGLATQLATDLRFVRTESIARHQALRIGFASSAAGTCYVVHTGSAAQCDCNAIAPEPVCQANAEEIKTVRVPTNERLSVRSNVASISFDPLHGTASPTGTLQVAGPQEKAIHHVVNVMGRVRSCSPAASVAGYVAC